MKRQGFTLLELVFSIVIFGMIFTALPTLLVTDVKTREASIVQEAIYASTAKMSQILSYKWDELSSENNTTISTAKVLDVPTSSETDTEFARAAGTKFRAGHFVGTGRRSFHSASTSTSLLGNDTGDLGADDIDDTVATTLINGDATAAGYKFDYNITVTPSYMSDIAIYTDTNQSGFEFENETNGTNRTNIKRIQIDVQDHTNEVIFSLRTYSTNIGETPVTSRIFN